MSFYCRVKRTFLLQLLGLIMFFPSVCLFAQEDGSPEFPYVIGDRQTLEAFRDCVNNPDVNGFFYVNGQPGKFLIDTTGTGCTEWRNVPRGGANTYFRLDADITLNSGNVAGCNGAGDPSWSMWTPIGNSVQGFLGDFDGNGHYVSGLYINREDNIQGLFGHIDDGARVHHVALVNSYIEARNSHFVGGIVGWNINSTVDHCFNASTIVASYNVGGIVGGNNKGSGSSGHSTVSYCYNTGTVKAVGTYAEDAGGIVGLNEQSCQINNCYNAGVVIVESATVEDGNFGGIAGNNKGVVHDNNYNDTYMCGSNGFGNSGEDVESRRMSSGIWNQVGGSDHWVFTAGYYPQLKVFAESTAANASLLSVVPLYTSNYENVDAIRSNASLGGVGHGAAWSSNYLARARVNGYNLSIVGRGKFIMTVTLDDNLYKAIYLVSEAGEPQGSEDNPLTIDNLDELLSFRAGVNNGGDFEYKEQIVPAGGRNTYFLLTSDINLNGEETNNYLTWNRTTAPSRVWTAIGPSDSVRFYGHFMGDGHTITGLYGGSFFGVIDTNASVTGLGLGVGNCLGDGGYVKDGLVIWLDGVENTRHGHDENTTVWENLVSHSYDFTANGYETMQWNKNGFYGTGNAGRWNCGAQWREIYAINSNNYFTVEAVAWINRSKTTPSNRTLVGTFRGSSYSNYYSGFSMYNYSSWRMPMYVENAPNNRMTTFTARQSGSYYLNGTYYNYCCYDAWQNVSLSTEPIIFGNGYNNERCWNDSIYGLRVYSRSLTEAEVRQNYQADYNHFVLGYSLRNASLVSKNLGTVSDCYSAVDNAPLVYFNEGRVSHCYNMGRFNEEGDATLVAVNQVGGVVEYGYYAGTSDHELKIVGANFGTVSNMYYDRQVAPRMNDALATAKTTSELTSGGMSLPSEHWTQSAGSYPYLAVAASNLAAKALSVPLTLASSEDVRRVSTAFTLCNGVDEVEWKVAAGDGVGLSACNATVSGIGQTILQATAYGQVYRSASLMVEDYDGFAFQIANLDQLKIFRDGINSGKAFYYDVANHTFSHTYDDNHQRLVPANGRGVKFALMSDIDMSGESSWTPIGTRTSSFQGEFDGQYNVVHDANWTMANFYNGLFGVAEHATIRNLGMEDCNIKGRNNNNYQDYSNFTGFICASFDGTMDACYTKSCKISRYNNTNSYFNGGVVGGLLGAGSGVMNNCYTQEDTMNMYFGYNNNTFYGGLAGVFSGKATNNYVKDSYMYLNSNCNGCGYNYDWHGHFGGLFGQVSSDTIAYCYNDHSALYCEDHDHGYLGGIAGGSDFATNFYHCYNTASVSGCLHVAGICPTYIASNVFENCFNTGEIVITANNNNNNSNERRAAGIGGGNARYCFNSGDIFNMNEYNNTTNRYVAGIVSHGSVNSCYNAGWVKGLNATYINPIHGQGNSASSYNTGKYVNNFTSNDYQVGYNDWQMAPYAPANNNNMIANMVSSSLSGSLGDDANWVFTPGKYPMLKGLEMYDASVVSATPIYLQDGENIDSVQHNFKVDTTMGVSWSVLDGDALVITGDSAYITGMGAVTIGASKNGVLYKKVYLVVGFSEQNPLIVRNLTELERFRDCINSGEMFFYNPTSGSEGYSLLDTGDYKVRVPAFGEASWFKQTADIDMITLPDWTPIGNHINSGFMGVYNGDGHTISNLTLPRKSGRMYSGLFARLGQGSGIRKLNMVRPNIDATYNNDGRYATGAIAAWVDGSGVRYLDSCSVVGANIKSVYRGGFLFGKTNAPVRFCTADSCSMTIHWDSYFGGIAAYANKEISDCKVLNSSISSYDNSSRGYSVGGIVGCAVGSCNVLRDTVCGVTITKVYNYIGGIAGQMSGNVRAEYCLAQSGKVSSVNASNAYSYIGGIVGYYSPSPNTNQILHCRNLGMEVEGGSYVGGICGQGVASYSSNFAKVTGKQYVGGISGYGINSYSSSHFNYCYNVGDVSASDMGNTNNYVGGIVGYVHSNYSGYCSCYYCFNTGKIKGSASGVYAVGGVTASSRTYYCYNAGEVAAGEYVGGLSGYSYASYGYNVGRVSGGTRVTAGTSNTTNNTNYDKTCFDKQMSPNAVYDTTNTGKAKLTTAMIGEQLKGTKISPNVSQDTTTWVHIEGMYPQLKYFYNSPDSLDRKVSCVSATPVFLYVNGDTVETVNNVTHTFTFGAGSADSVRWAVANGSGLAVMDNIGSPLDSIGVASASAYLHDTIPYKTVRFLLNVTEPNALIIKDYTNLKIFREGVNSGKVFYYKMATQEFDTASHAGDITYMEIPVGGEEIHFRMAPNVYDLSDTAWTPIGTAESPFKGHFNGSHQLIDNMTVNKNSEYAGFFGFALGNYIKNLRFANAKVTGTSYVGVLAGATVSRVDSVSAYNDTVRATGMYVGGLIGRVENHVDSCCFVNGSVKKTSGSGDYLGGILGYGYYMDISRCHTENTEVYNNNSYVGGIAGYLQRGSVIDCHNVGGTVYGGSSYTGGVLGYFYNYYNNGNSWTYWNGSINRCGNSSYVKGSSNYTGGILGYGADYAHVTFSYNTGEVSGYYYSGGIAGITYGRVSYCINTGDVSSYYQYGSYTSGVVSYSNYTVEYSINTGMVTQLNGRSDYSPYVGGISAQSSSNNCFNAGEVDGNNAAYTCGIYSGSSNINVGRIHGNREVYAIRSGNNSFSDKQMCPSILNNSSYEKTTEGMLGDSLKGSLSEDYWIFEEGMYPRLRWTDSLEWARPIAIAASTPMRLSTGPEVEHVNSVASTLYLNGQDSVIWKVLRGGGFIKDNDYQYSPSATIGIEYLGVAWSADPDSILKTVRIINISEDNPVIIKNKEELVKFRDYINSGKEFYYDPVNYVFYETTDNLDFIPIPCGGEAIHFRLDADVDLSDIYYWTPIGVLSSYQVKPFKGYFNGNNKEILGLKTNGQYCGFFGYTVDGSIKNTYLVTATNNSAGSYSAVLCGYARRSTLKDNTVSSSKITNSYNNYNGVICGYADNCTIDNNLVESTDINSYSSYCGGICGYANNSNITNNRYENSQITQNGTYQYLGGICGYANNTLIDSCHVSHVDMKINSGSYNIGGVCGYSLNSTIMNSSYESSELSSSSSYNVGGICGYSEGAGGKISQCYNSSDIQGAKVGGICGVNTNNIERSYNTGVITENNYNSESFNIGGITSSGNVTDCYNAGRIIVSRAVNAGGIAGIGNVTRCYNIGYIEQRGFSNTGMLTGSGNVVNSFNDVQMNPYGTANNNSKKSTRQMVGTSLQNNLGDESWVYSAGMYPILKGMDTIANAVAYAIPVYLYGSQNVDMVRTQFTVSNSTDALSSWSGPELALNLATVNTDDSVKIRICGTDTLAVTYKNETKRIPMNVDRLEVTIFDAHTCGEPYFWPVANKTYTRSGNYTEAFAVNDKCDSIVTLRLFVPTVRLAVYPRFTNVTCYNNNDGTLSADLEGGSGTYNIVWLNLSGDTISLDADVSNLPPGDYTIVVIDSLYDDCSVTASVSITQPDSLEAGILASSPGCFGFDDGYIDVFVKGGTKPYTVSFNNGTVSKVQTISLADTFRLNNLPDGNWSVSIVDYNGCSVDSMTTEFHQEPRSFVVRGCGLEKMYDGIEVVVDSFTLAINGETPFRPTLDANNEYMIVDSAGKYKDYLHVEMAGVTRTDAGFEYNHVSVCEVIRRYDDTSIPNDTITCQYDISTIDGLVNITKRSMLLTSASKVQVGNVYPLSAPTVTEEGDGWAVGDVMTYTNFAELTDYGIIPNTFDTVCTPAGFTKNYDIHIVYGNLAIVHDSTEILITAATDFKMYDCNPLENHNFTVTSATALPDSFQVTVTFADTSVLTDAGERVNHIVSYMIYDTVHHNDWTSVYNKVHLIDGKLTVNKRTIIMASMSDEREYNALPLVRPELLYSGDGFAECDTVGTIEVTGSQTIPGSSPNTISYTTTPSFKLSNYNWNVTEGTLTVTKRKMTISGDSLEIEYDGRAHELTNIHVSGLVSGQYITDLIYTTGEHSSVGVYPGEFSGTLRIMAADSVTDVTAYYDVETPYTIGKLVILENMDHFLFVSTDASKVYDGIVLKKETYMVYHDGVALSRTAEGTYVIPSTGDTIHIIPTFAGAKDVGTYDNTFDYSFTRDNVDVLSNYHAGNIVTKYGEIEITKRPLILESDSIVHVYTGYPISAPFVEVGGYGFAEQDGGIMEGASFDNFASRTNVGQTENTFTIIFNANTDPDNYDIDTIYGYIIIEPALLTLTADDSTRQFGDPNPTLTYSVSGLVGADEPDVILTEPELTTVATLDSPVGTYPIVIDVSTASAQNYIFTGGDGTLTIVPRHIELSTRTDTVVYDALPHNLDNQFEPYTLTLNGYDYVADFSAATSHTGDQTNAYTYTNTFTSAKTSIRIRRDGSDQTSQFIIDTVYEGHLTIVPDTLTVTAVDTFRLYGIPNPVFRSEITGFDGSDTRTSCVFGVITYTTEATLTSLPGAGSMTSGKYWIVPDVSGLGSCYSNYVFVADTGALDVIDNNLPLLIFSEGETFVYDGTAHTNHVYTVSFNGSDIPAVSGSDGLMFRLPVGDTIVVTPDASASITNVGKRINSFSYTLQHSIYYTNVSAFADTLEVVPCPVSVTILGARDTTVYDGDDHHVSGYEMTSDKPLLYTVHDFTCSGTAYASRINTGESFMGLEASMFNNINANFIATFTVNDGLQKITPITDTVDVTIVGNNNSTVYDGTEHSVSGYEVLNISHPKYNVTCFTCDTTPMAARIDSGTTYMGVASRHFRNTSENFVNVNFLVTDGYQTITPITTEVVVTIVGNHSSDMYDGTEHSVSGYQISDISNSLYHNDNFVYMGASADTVANGTTVGVYAMSLADSMFRNTSGNFTHVTFAVTPGYEEILVNTDHIVVTVSGHIDTVVYDGTSHDVKGFDYAADYALYNTGIDTNFSYSGDSTATGINAGNYPMGLLSSDFENTNPNFNNVEFVITDGRLVIKPLTGVQVSIEGHYAVNVYDAIEHSVTGFNMTPNNMLYTAADFHYTGDSIAKRTYKGTTYMELSASDFENVSPNFKDVEFIVVADGYQTIDPNTTPVTVTVTGHHSSGEYDGDSHAVTGFDLESDNPLFPTSHVLFNGTADDSTAICQFVDTVYMGLDAGMFCFVDTNMTNVTIVIGADGYQAVTKRTFEVVVTLRKKGAETTYDGHEQRVTGYTLVSINDALYLDTSFMYSGTLDDTVAKGRYVGSYEMAVDESMFANINMNFANVTFVMQRDSMVILPNPTPITIYGGSATKSYDGIALTSSNFTYLPAGVFAEGDSLVAIVDGSRTEVGTSPNRVVEYRVYRDESKNTSMIHPGLRMMITPPSGYTKDVTDCYTFANPDTVSGLLTVTKNENVVVTVVGHTGEYNYDGSIHTVHGYDVTVTDTLGIYTMSDFHFTGGSTMEESAVNTWPMGLTATSFMNDNMNFEPTFDVTDGWLKIYDSLVVTVTATTNVSCDGVNDGTAEISVIGGKPVTPRYTYVVDGVTTLDTLTGTSDGTISLSGLKADHYKVYVIDSLSYTDTASFDIIELKPLIAKLSVQPNLCPNQSEYGLTVVVTGGNGGNHYVWGADANDVDAEITTVTGLTGDCGHEYEAIVMVTDMYGCKAKDSLKFMVTDTEKPSFIVPADIILCREMDGSINASTIVTGEPSNLSDNCTPSTLIEIRPFRDIDTTGTDMQKRVIHREWVVRDQCGNDSVQVQNITILPAMTDANSLIKCPTNIDTVIKHGGCNLLIVDIGTPVFTTDILDFAPGQVVISNDAPTDHIYEVGTTTVTWTATDTVCNFSISCTQIIKVSFQACPDAVDIEGNSYPSVRLGSGCKCWTTENLKSTQYSDGRSVDNVMDYYSREYPNTTENVNIFGHLYNWYAAADTGRYGSVDSVERAYNMGHRIQGICPDGWYLPSDDEYEELNMYPTTDLRSTDYWINVSGQVNTNATGFNSLPGGKYNCATGRFEEMMGNSYYWTCHPVYDIATGAMIDYVCEKITIVKDSHCNGYSIRCIWDEH